jgi:hypothetical protein
MGRQVGAALGIAVLVAVLGTGATTVAEFHSAWLICTAGGVLAGLTLAALGRPARSAAPAAVAADAEIAVAEFSTVGEVAR